jgi:hypothetical protein
MGVNEFLEGLRNSNDKLFYPEFVDFEYWSRRYLAWEEGDYTDDELELFGFTKGNAPKIDVHPDLKTFDASKYDESKIKKAFDNVTTKQQRDLRAKMEDKWKHQALFGDVVHLIGQKLFSTIESGSNKDKMWIEIVDDNMDYFINNMLDPKKYDSEKRPIREKFSDD